MKKYSTLAELLIDYRAYRNLSQIDFAALLDVDVRTVLRWEKNESLIKLEKEKIFTEIFGIPHQVMRNLNTDMPISVFYDIKRRVYSLSEISQMVESDSKYNAEVEINSERIRLISRDSDFEFVTDIQKSDKNNRPLKAEIIKKATNILPELNLIICDYSGFYAGHITILPLKYDIYAKIRNQEMDEGDLKLNDLTVSFTEKPLVFYFYSLYADSIDNAHYMINRILTHFKHKKYEDYVFTGISYRQPKTKLLTEFGLNIVWQKPVEENSIENRTFLEGNFDKYLFGK
jgi:transcriptional regulator with XRE-family HTH domain